jgi:hypothetical protein
MFKKILLVLGFSLLTSSAFAACTNPLPILNGSSGTVNMSVSQNTADAGCMYNVTPNQGGAPLSATNGWWTNILQGNVALSATNGLYANILQGNVANSAANPFFFAPATSSVWPVSVASLPLPSGAATAANQSTEIGSLGTIATNSGLPLPAQSTHTVDIGGTDQLSAYPAGATPITASATGATAATTATLAGTTGKTTYICSLSVRANATANTNVTDTVTGVITGTLSRALWVPANTAGLGVDEQIYNPCVPASGTNQAIAVVSGAPGTGGVVTVNATGYQQ